MLPCAAALFGGFRLLLAFVLLFGLPDDGVAALLVLEAGGPAAATVTAPVAFGLDFATVFLAARAPFFVELPAAFPPAPVLPATPFGEEARRGGVWGGVPAFRFAEAGGREEEGVGVRDPEEGRAAAACPPGAGLGDPTCSSGVAYPCPSSV